MTKERLKVQGGEMKDARNVLEGAADAVVGCGMHCGGVLVVMEKVEFLWRMVDEEFVLNRKYSLKM